MAASNLAVYYHPDGYETKSRPLMGRRAAGKSFLDAWFDRRGDGDTYCVAARQQDFQHFADHARSRSVTGRSHWLRLERIETVAQTGTLYFPGPDIAINAWRRHRRDPRGFSIMGVTHTICTKAVMDGVAEWLTAPVEPWDAVICTSNAVRQSVDYLLAAQREHLSRRTGATRFPQPQLPVIPLGINTQEFAADEAMRGQMRQKLGIGADDVAFLFVGRLSIFGKAHPMPMFIALERAARATGKKVHLILCGWYATKGLEKAFSDGAAYWCPSVTLHNVDGRNDEERGGAWRAGDVFVSLVDNIQETFGLTPVESMAAGLPAVVSDWDGYRDTVRHNIDGIRVPTLQAPASFGEGLVDRYAADIDSYDLYLARSTYNVVVDVDATVAAFVRLINDPDLRRRMGEAGRARAISEYDWQHVLGRYEDLAGQLGELRNQSAPLDPKQRRVWPSRMSPFELFANYPTRMPQLTDRVIVCADDVDMLIEGIRRDTNEMLDRAEVLIPNLRALVAEVGTGGRTIEELLKPYDLAARMQRLAMVLRLAKFGVVSVVPVDGPGKVKAGPSDQV
jgi:glycosyltransferase involved in cell wall biosynthesis